MCKSIVLLDGPNGSYVQHMDTMREAMRFFGRRALESANSAKVLDPRFIDSCLCQMDNEATAVAAGFQFKAGPVDDEIWKSD